MLPAHNQQRENWSTNSAPRLNENTDPCPAHDALVPTHAHTAGAPSHTKLVIHPSVPYALSWGVSIVAAGNDGQVREQGARLTRGNTKQRFLNP